MNKTAQVFIGLAIAIVFPVFVFYAGVTFIPTHETSPAAYPTYPEQPVYPAYYSYCQGVYNSASGKYGGTNPAICVEQVQQYKIDQAAYDVKLKAYDAAVKAYDDKNKADQLYNDKVTVYRGFVGIGFALLGLAALLAVASIPALVYGIASGAGLTLLGSITAILTAPNADMQKLVAGILIGLFVLLTTMAMVFDRQFTEPAKHDLPLVPPVPPVPDQAPLPAELVTPIMPESAKPDATFAMPTIPVNPEGSDVPKPATVGPQEDSHWFEHNK
jgi:hypothetical protein